MPLLTKANENEHKLKTYTDLTQIGITVGEETFDGIAGAMLDGSKLTFSVNTAQNADIYPYPYGVCEVIRVSAARILFEFADNNGSRHWNGAYYYTASPTFAGWSLIATATPPQEYDLPLAAGWAHLNNTDPLVYGKDGTGKVKLYGCIIAPTSPKIGAVVANFPAGYIPARQVWVMAVGVSGTSYPIRIDAIGNMCLWGIAPAASEVLVFPVQHFHAAP